MTRSKRRLSRLGRYQPPGTAPGVMSFDPEAPSPTIRILAYGSGGIEELALESVEDLRGILQKWPVVWIDVVGFGQGEELESLRTELGLHILAMEDVVALGQRAKVERYDDTMFVIGRMTSKPPRLTEQISLFLGSGWLLTIQERAGDPFNPVRERIRQSSGRLRSRGADYLLYALLDAVVDSYFPVLDQIGDELDVLEDDVLEDPSPESAQEIHSVRRKLVGLRKALAPQRDAVAALLREDHPLISDETLIYFRDVHDHALRSTELTESYREMTGDLVAAQMAGMSNKMNEVMKVLTIIASIFIPLSFIAGLYGMNFDPAVSDWNMPELGWTYGYPFALALMLGVGLGFIAWLWRRGWLR